MPFESEAQRRFMFAKHPAIAHRWAHEYPNQGKLPAHKKDAKSKVAEALMNRSQRR
jgi:hypothetical protein